MVVDGRYLNGEKNMKTRHDGQFQIAKPFLIEMPLKNMILIAQMPCHAQFRSNNTFDSFTHSPPTPR
jgi:hypothetical protein